MTQENYAWLDAEPDVRPSTHSPTTDVMRQGALEGKDRVWWCDGEHIWFRRRKANPATLERHNRFVSQGDYQFVATHDDVECYKLREQSIFAIKQPKTIDLNTLDFYNVKRLACKAAMKGDWQQFQDIAVYMRDRLNQNVGPNTATKWTQQWADMNFADHYESLIEMVARRNGPSPQQINIELARLMRGKPAATGRVITLG